MQKLFQDFDFQIAKEKSMINLQRIFGVKKITKQTFSSGISLLEFYESFTFSYDITSFEINPTIHQINNILSLLISSNTLEEYFEGPKYKLCLLLQDLAKSLEVLNIFVASEEKQLQKECEVLKTSSTLKNFKLLDAKKEKILATAFCIKLFCTSIWRFQAGPALQIMINEIENLPNNEHEFLLYTNRILARFTYAFKSFISYVNYTVGLDEKYNDRDFATLFLGKEQVFVNSSGNPYMPFRNLLDEEFMAFKYRVIFASDLYELRKQKILSDDSNNVTIYKEDNFIALMQKKLNKIVAKNKCCERFRIDSLVDYRKWAKKTKKESKNFITKHPDIEQILKSYFQEHIYPIIPENELDRELFLFRERKKFYYDWYYNFVEGRDKYNLNISVPKKDIESKPFVNRYEVEHPTITIKKKIRKLRPIQGDNNNCTESMGLYRQDNYTVETIIAKEIVEEDQIEMPQVDNALENNNTIISDNMEGIMLHTSNRKTEDMVETDFTETHYDQELENRNTEQNQRPNYQTNIHQEVGNVQTPTPKTAIRRFSNSSDDNFETIDISSNKRLLPKNFAKIFYAQIFPIGISILASSALGFGLYHALEETEAFANAPEANIGVIVYTSLLATVILLALFQKYHTSISSEIER